MAHQAGAYPGFYGMKRLGVFLLPPGWDASPSQGYPSALNSPVPIYTPGWREALWELSVLRKNTTQCPRSGLEPRPLAPETSALTTRPPRLPWDLEHQTLNVTSKVNTPHVFHIQGLYSFTFQTWQKLMPRSHQSLNMFKSCLVKHGLKLFSL